MGTPKGGRADAKEGETVASFFFRFSQSLCGVKTEHSISTRRYIIRLACNQRTKQGLKNTETFVALALVLGCACVASEKQA